MGFTLRFHIFSNLHLILFAIIVNIDINIVYVVTKQKSMQSIDSNIGQLQQEDAKLPLGHRVKQLPVYRMCALLFNAGCNKQVFSPKP